MDRNPYASPATSAEAGALRRVPIGGVPAEPAHGAIDVVEQAAKPPRAWRLSLGEEEAWLWVPGEETAFAFTHRDLGEHANIMPWGRTVMLAMRGMRPGGRAVAFKIEADGVATFRRWIVLRPDVLAAALKKRLRFSFPLGLFVAVTALPVLGPTFDPFAFAFGSGLVVLAVIGPRHPRRGLLAFDAVLWFCLAASHASAAYQGTTWSIFFAILSLLIGRQSLAAYRFYRAP